jgi:hypothetical protein
VFESGGCHCLLKKRCRIREKMTNNKKAAVLLDEKEQDKRNLF